MRVFTKIACFLPVNCFSLITQPWLGNLLEADLVPAYTYRHYPNIQGAYTPYASSDQILSFNFATAISTQFDCELEVEVADTTKQSWGMRSGAIQARYLWLNDIAGDAISLITGCSLRDVSKRNLIDVSCPYAARINYELFSAVGKEWSEELHWDKRIYIWLALGIASRGSWWARQELSYESNWCNRHAVKVSLQGNFGFGDLRQVEVNRFYDWGRYKHQSIDLGACYRYQFSCYGIFSISYAYRVFARTFPERVHCVTLMYAFPFGLF